MTNLYPYQRDQADFLVDTLRAHRGAANLSPMGTGKTLVGCEVVRRLGDPATVVVCPPAASSAWRRWGAELGVEVELTSYDKLRNGRSPFGHWKTREWCGRIIRDFEWNREVGLIIYDEAHRCKGEKTLNSKTLIGAHRAGIPTLLQTATLAETPLDLKAAGLLLGLYKQDFWGWAQKNGCYRSPWGGLKFTENRVRGLEIMSRLNQQLMQRSCRISYAEIPDFPETQIEPLMLTLDNPEEVDRLYETMSASLDALHEASLNDVNPEHPLTSLLRARQQLETLKVPLMVDYAADAREQGMSIVLFFNFSESVQRAVEMLSEYDRTVTIVGGQSERQRAESERLFQTNDVRQLVAQSDAGNLALSLHDLDGGFPRMVVASPGWSGMGMRQLFGRVCRVGGRSKSLQRVALISDSVEEQVAGAFSGKLNNLDMLQDQDFMPLNLTINRKRK